MKPSLFGLSLALAIATIGIMPAAAPAADADRSPFAPTVKPTASFDVGTLHIEKYGSGTPVLVLVPGLAGGPWVWQGTIAEFAGSHTIYAITLPGFDGRAATDRKPLFATFLSDFWAFLAAEKLEKPVVIGHSLGGTLAIALAEQHSERLAGIVAVDGLPVFPTLAVATPSQREGMASSMAQNAASLDPAAELAGQEAYMGAIGTIRPELVKPSAILEARSDPRAIAEWMREDLAGDLRPELAKITIPLLEIMPYNPADQRPPAAYSREQTLGFYRSLLAGAPNATVLAIEPSRHFVMLDQPEAFHRALAQFLTSVR
jgi:pimeloyl-ACP methyl ester carboxylesterase